MGAAFEAKRCEAEYETMLVRANEIAEREKNEIEMARKKRIEHRDGLMSQIIEKENLRVQNREHKIIEGNQLKHEFAMELGKLEDARKKIVTEFEQRGVDPQYLSEMQRADMRKFQL